MGRPCVAIVGCGAVTEKAHLPALRTLGVTPALLVDRDLERARRLADEFGVPRTGDDYREVIDGADAAIVALRTSSTPR